MKCALPSKGVSLASVFSAVEARKKELRIIDYAVSQTSLEQVFLSFAKLQEQEGADADAAGGAAGDSKSKSCGLCGGCCGSPLEQPQVVQETTSNTNGGGGEKLEVHEF